MDDEAIAELFAALGPVRTRRMFGGRGIYRGERIVAIEVDGTVYLKADDATRPVLEAAGSEPFRYERNGAVATMDYWRVPDEAYDDPDEASRWARLAGEAAQRAPAPKRRSRRRPMGG